MADLKNDVPSYFLIKTKGVFQTLPDTPFECVLLIVLMALHFSVFHRITESSRLD